MKNWKRLIACVSVLAMSFGLFAGCGSGQAEKREDKKTETKTVDINDMTFEQMKETAKGTTVNFYGWGGSQATNDWIDKYLAPIVKEDYDITLNRVGMNIEDILTLMQQEKTAGKKDGSVDLVWINGENFYTAKQGGLLYGPFTDRLPNFEKYVDVNSEEITQDFGYKTDGFEAPYSKAQFVMVYDSTKIPNPPKSAKELLEWCKANPGKFTYPAPPDFTGSAFVRNIISDLVGYKQFMNTKDETQIRKDVKPAMDYFNELKPLLWNEGKTYPPDNPTLINMFQDGEVEMCMSYDPNFASLEIEQGRLPKTTKTFLFDKGTVGNTSFVAIGQNSANKAGAMLVANAILSVKAQATKYDPKIWGALSVLDMNKLSPEEKQEFEKIKVGTATLPLDELLSHRIPEMPADVVPVIEKIWTEEVLSK